MAAERAPPTSTLVWQPSPGSHAVTVVTKLTFDLTPGELVLSAAQDPIVEADAYWDDDPRRALTAASDLVPTKARVDVVLTGSAFAPGGRPTPKLVARIKVSNVDKSVEVHGDRALSPTGDAGPAAPFARMRLTYERALGGPGTWNPVGVGAGGPRALPNLVPPGTSAHAAGAAPTSFGPIAPTWAPRTEVDGEYFNVAPVDQRAARLDDDAELLLQNLHPAHPILVTRLPGLRPKATLATASGPLPVTLVADTLWVDTDRGLCTVTWRGHIELREAPHAPIAQVELQKAPARPGATQGSPPDDDSPATRGRTMIGSFESIRAALPFMAATPSSARGVAPRAPLETMPFVAPTHEAPPPIPAPPVSAPGISPRPAAASAPHVPPTQQALNAPAYAMPSYSIAAGPSSTDRSRPGMAHASSAALAGVMGASHAAADPTRLPPSAPSLATFAGNVIDLVWFDPAVPERARKSPEWRPIYEAAAQRPPEPGINAPGLADEPADLEDRQEIFELLVSATPSSELDVEHALITAVRPDGRFAPRLLMLAGELRFDFDPIEVLRATAASAAPFTSNDEELARAVTEAKAFLGQAGMVPAPGIAARLTASIREAYAKTPTIVGPAFVDDQSERALLEKRAYERRDVFGAMHLRALFFQLGSTNGIPTYLPETLARELPTFRRMRVRLLVEVHFQADQYETHPAAMRAAAFARVVRSA